MKSHPRSPLSVSSPSPPRTRSAPRPAFTMSAPRPARTRSRPAERVDRVVAGSAEDHVVLRRSGQHVRAGVADHHGRRRTAAATSATADAPIRTVRNLLLRCATGASSLVGGCPSNRSGRGELRCGSSGPRGLLRVRADLGEDALEPRLGVAVDEASSRPPRRGARARSRVQRVRHGAVGRVALAAGAQLDQVHGLARVHVEHVADPVAERRARSAPARAARRRRSASYSSRERSRPRAVQVADARVVELVAARPAPSSGPSVCHWTVSSRWRWRSRNAP